MPSDTGLNVPGFRPDASSPRRRTRKHAAAVPLLVVLWIATFGCSAVESAPVIEDLRVENVVCDVQITVHWFDEYGALDGGRMHAEFDELSFHATVESYNAVETDLTMNVPLMLVYPWGDIESMGLLPEHSYDLSVWAESPGGQVSNTLTTDAFETASDVDCWGS